MTHQSHILSFSKQIQNKVIVFIMLSQFCAVIRGVKSLSIDLHSEKGHEKLITSTALLSTVLSLIPFIPLSSQSTEKLNLHLPLDVVLQQVLIHRVQIVAAHVVVVVGDRAVILLAIRVFCIIGLVAVVVIIVTFTREKECF